MDYQSDEKDGGEDLKVRPVKMGIKAAVSRIRSATVQHHHGCPWGWSRDLHATMKGASGKQE